MKYKGPLIILILIVISACSKFDYSPYQVSPKDGYSSINQTNISRFTNGKPDTLRIAIIGDSQRFYDATRKVINKINNIPSINFTIHTGDIVDFGLQKEYTWSHELLSQINAPYVAVVGNHDLIGNGDEIYKLMYGPFDFSFVFNGYKFIYLNTNSREFGFANYVPNISWLDNQLSDTLNYNQAIIVNHVPPFNNDFNSALENSYVSTLGKYGKVKLEINGHNHNYSISEPYNDGISYINSYSTEKEKFVLLKIWNNGFSVESI
jgi:Icc-related predicted phosphoesterase